MLLLLDLKHFRNSNTFRFSSLKYQKQSTKAVPYNERPKMKRDTQQSFPLEKDCCFVGYLSLFLAVHRTLRLYYYPEIDFKPSDSSDFPPSIEQ